jgi:hypothetical protein
MLLASRLRLRPWTDVLRSAWTRRGVALLLAAAFEVLGRLSPNELVDALVVLALVAAVSVLVASDLETWRARGRVLAARLDEVTAPFRSLCGLDMRGTPALPARTPFLWLVPVVAALALSTGAWLARGVFPADARETLRAASGLLYLAYVTLLWSTLAAGALAAWALVSWFLVALLSQRAAGIARGLLFGATGIGAILLPPLVPLVVVLAACALQALAHLAGPPIPLVWRYKSESRTLHRGHAALWQIAMTSSLFGLLLVPAFLALGADLDGAAPAPATLLSPLLGRFFLGTLATAAAVLLGHEAWQLFRARGRDPARAIPTRVLLAGDASASEHRRASELLSRAGFVPVDRARPGTLEVRLTLVPPGRAQPVAADAPAARHGRWSLETTADALADAAVLARLARRDVVQRRRALLRGLEKILKSAARRRFAKGTGFWLGCNHWFITHLSRDTDEHPISCVGLPFRRALPLAARSHWARVLSDLELDLVFLEDGVGFRRLRRVVAAVFEYHDLFGKRRLADERHFLGLPGVRVMIHDFELERPLVRTGYPEPDYEELGRARILHVFRDRGEGWEPSVAPRRGDRRPVLVG